MKIVSIGQHCCIRMLKQALALSERHEVHGIGFQKPMIMKCFKTFHLVSSKEQFLESLKAHDDADIFHVHNEPNWPVVLIKQLFPDKKVVLDIHDSMAYRSDKPEYMNAVMERTSFDLADGVVYVSEGCKSITESIRGEKPNVVLPPYVNRDFYTTNECNWVGGLVYEGLVATDKTRDVMQYANYKNLSKALNDKGVPFHVYNPNADEYTKKFYEEIIFEGGRSYDQLIREMAQFDWGVVGNIDVYKDWQVAMPNKLFEYMAAGIPIVAFNAKESGDFIESNGVGIHVKSVDELIDRWDERQACQRNVYLKRHNFCMENMIGELEELYDSISGTEKGLLPETSREDENFPKEGFSYNEDSSGGNGKACSGRRMR